MGNLLLTLGTHVQEGYGSCVVCVSVCVCLSVTTLLATFVISTLKMRYGGGVFSRFLTRRFSIYPFVQKFTV